MLRPTLDAIRAAHKRILPHIHETPVMTSRAINALVGADLFFKCENFQRVGAFKARGAFNAVLQLPEDLASYGVVTHSSGNHAAALALAARERGIPAYVVMPRTAPEVKKAAVAGYGAQILECEPTLAAREAMTAHLAREKGATFIAPFEDAHVIAGQGTVALELLAQAGPLDAVTCPVGGGGLLAGTAIAVSELAPETHIVAAEPKAADDAAVGYARRQMQPQRLPVATIADGLTTAMGPQTFAIMCDKVHGVATVSEAAILEAMRLIWTRMKILVEPSSAVPLAALLEGAWPQGPQAHRGKRIGIILTGGNVDLDRLPW